MNQSDAILKLEFCKPVEQDREQWYSLYSAYGEGSDDYTWDENKAAIVWSWLNVPTHPLECIVAKANTNQLTGFIHYREAPHPGHACNYGYIQDIYVLPQYRRKGIATALIEQVRGLGRQRAWKFLRWTSYTNNREAQKLYDRIARRKDRIVYELKIN